MIPRIYVRDHTDHVLFALDVDDYKDDKLQQFVAGRGAIFEMTFTKGEDDYEKVNSSCKLSWIDQETQEEFWLNIIDVEQDEFDMTITATSLNLELTNEDIGPYKSNGPISFEEYFNTINFEKGMRLNINELSDRRIAVEWEGTDKKLARLYSLATKFSGEVEFLTVLNNDGSLKEIIVNAYRAHDNQNQGIGTDRRGVIYRWGDEIKTIEKKENSENVRSAIIPIGKDGLTIANLEREIFDDDGNLLYCTYKTPKPGFPDPRKLYAPQTRERFASVIGSEDGWLVAVPGELEYTTATALLAYAITELTKMSVPEVTWTIEGYIDAFIGDSVRIVDSGYKPELIIDARITEQSRSYTKPEKNVSTFSNVVELQSQVDQSLIDRVNAIIAANKRYTYLVTTTNGQIFVDSIGDSTLTARVLDGVSNVTDNFTIVWFKDNVEVGRGKTLLVKSSDFTTKAVYRFEAQNDAGDVLGGYELTMSNINNGVGIKTTKVEYATGTSQTTPPTTGWQATPPTVAANQYLWTRITLTYDDGTTVASYSVGAIGAQGPQGPAGPSGNGIASSNVSYAAGTSGTTAPTTGWQTTPPTVAADQYLWTRIVLNYTNATSTTSYAVGKMGAQGPQGAKGETGPQGPTGPKGDTGNQGIQGPQGPDGKPSYTHWAYAWSADGTDRFTDTYPNENLALNSQELITIPSANNAYNYATVYRNMPSNVDVTYSAEVSAPSGHTLPGRVTVYAYTSTTNFGTRVDAWVVDGKIKATLRTTYEGTNIIVYTGVAGTAQNRAMSLSKQKVEIGDTATIWTPNPAEDFANAYPTFAGSYVDDQPTDSEDPTKYVWQRLLGDSGVGIKTTVVEYAVGTSATTAPTSDWQATPPAVGTNQYLWTRITLTYDDESVVTSYSVGARGAQGPQGPTGPSGNGIDTSVVTYAAGTTGTTAPTTGWQATPPTVAANQYLWTRIVLTYTDGSSTTSYAVGKMGAQGPQGAKGDTGPQGPTGPTGNGISSSTISYAASTSGTTAPSTGWQGTPPTVAANSYLWTRVIINYTDGSSSTSYSVGKMGAQGPQGDAGPQGPTGPTGNGIASSNVTYAASASGTTAPTGGWATTPPTVAANQFLWTQVVITYTNGSSTTAYSVGKMGAQGPQGAKGDTGPQGPTGPTGNGIASSNVSYAASTSGTTAPSTGWQATPPTVAANSFLWTRVIINYTDNTSSTSYSVGKMGAQGPQGDAGPQGPTGNGISSSSVNYATNTSGTTAPTTGWQTTPPTVAANSYLWTRVVITYTNGTTTTAYSVGKMGAQGPKGDTGAQGPTGPQGPQGPQGIQGVAYLSPTQPSTTQNGAQWFKTVSTTDRTVTEIYTYVTGAGWVKTPLAAGTLAVTRLDAISSNFGTMTAGTINGVVINGSEFNNAFSYTEGGVTYTGTTSVKDGNVIIDRTGSDGSKWTTKLDRVLGFEDNYKAGASAPARYTRLGRGRLEMAEAGVGGYLPAAALYTTPWVNLPLVSGYVVAENNPPQYRIFNQLDGSKLVRFRGQFTATAGSMNAGSHRPFGNNTFPAEIQPNRTEFSWGLTNTRQGGRLSVTTSGDFQFQVDFTCTYCAISQLSYIVD